MGPSAADDGRQVAGDDCLTGEYAVVATCEQRPTGLCVGMAALDVQCSSCSTRAMRDKYARRERHPTRYERLRLGTKP